VSDDRIEILHMALSERDRDRVVAEAGRLSRLLELDAQPETLAAG
jgi:hypothetical protein